MISLYGGCSRSEIKVIPKNWQSKSASIRRDWKIYYRFYDPSSPKRKKELAIRGMNPYKTLEERQEITRGLIDQEKYLVDQLGYNPITGQRMAPAEAGPNEITPHTNFIEALRKATVMTKVVENTRDSLKSVVNSVERASKSLYDNTHYCHYNRLSIGDVRRKHIKYILQWHETNNPRFTDSTFNAYKRHISMLFIELIELEAMEYNYTRDIRTREIVRKKKVLLTPAEQKEVEGLRQTHYHFWRYIRIFFRSGCRTTEMFGLKKEMVDLEKQEFIILLKKGRQYVEDTRGIADDVLDLWKEVMSEATVGQYLFSRGFRPYDKPVKRQLADRWWKKLVKEGMGITVDFYGLKYLNTDEVARLINIEAAQAADGHKDKRTTMLYAVNEKERQREKLKRLEVKFAG